MFGFTTLFAAVFGVFRWLGLEPRTSLFVAAVLAISLAGAISLVVAMGRYGTDESETQRPGSRQGRDDKTGGNEDQRRR